jgi:Fe-S oxidoreductase
MKTLVFIVLLAASFGFFAMTMRSFVRAMNRGVADPRPRWDQIPARIASVLIYFLGQKKVAEEGPNHQTSKHHLLIFWGFMIITIATVDVLVSGVVPAISLALLPDLVEVPLTIVIDVFNVLVLAMIVWAFIRRIFVRPPLIPMNLDAGLILGGIGSLMITHLLVHGYHIAAEVTAGGAYPVGYPVSGLVARALAPIAADTGATGGAMAFWLHVLIILTFLNYLPYSKHIHLLGALPNIFFRNLSERKLDLPKIDLEDEKQWGVGDVSQFSWKSLLDTYACTECARCTNYCPAYATGKNLSPMQLIHDIRYEMLDRDAAQMKIGELEREVAAFDGAQVDDHGHRYPDLIHAEEELVSAKQALTAMPRLTGGRVAEDTLWACTTCGACHEVCPVFIEHPLKIIQMRQNLVLEQEKVPAELARAFRNIERQSNPWGVANDKRMDWAEGLNVPTIEERPNPEYILWVGCAGAFDARIIKQTRAMIKVLEAAEVDYAVLGHQEGCTGDPARRSGNEMLFQMQAESNVETLNSVGAKKVITSCPHCLHTLKNDYPQFGGNFEVVHHTQLLSHLLEAGKLKPEKQSVASITYHDSCYLGRWNGEFDAPRDILKSLDIPGGVTELTRNKKHGFCCGAGGGRMFMEEEGARVNVNRTDEILATKVAAVAVACPFCNIMITDGMKQRDREEDVAVLDVAELLANSLPDVPASALARKKRPHAS